MTFDAQQLLSDMTDAARGAFEEDWPRAREYVEIEFSEYLHTLGMIAQLLADGSITRERARMHLDFQRRSMRAVLATVQGLGTIAVENAVNAAMGAVRDTVNTVIGFRLL